MPVSKDEYDAYGFGLNPLGETPEEIGKRIAKDVLADVFGPPKEPTCQCCHGAYCELHDASPEHILLHAEAESESDDELVVMVHDYLATLKPDERIEFLGKLRGNYCEHCGNLQRDGRSCQCWNDE